MAGRLTSNLRSLIIAIEKHVPITVGNWNRPFTGDLENAFQSGTAALPFLFCLLHLWTRTLAAFIPFIRVNRFVSDWMI